MAGPRRAERMHRQHFGVPPIEVLANNVSGIRKPKPLDADGAVNKQMLTTGQTHFLKNSELPSIHLRSRTNVMPNNGHLGLPDRGRNSAQALQKKVPKVTPDDAAVKQWSPHNSFPAS